MQVSPQNTVSPQDVKGKASMVHNQFKRRPGTDKWMVSIVIEQGRMISKLEYRMTSYDPRTFRAFFEPIQTTKPMRLYANTSKRQRPKISSITLFEYNQGRITAEEQISLHPLSFSVNDYGIFCLFRDKSFWHMYVQVSTEDHSNEFTKRDPQRWIQPLGFEVEVIMDDFSDKKGPNVVIEEFIDSEDENSKDDNKEDDESKPTMITVNGTPIDEDVVATPPPVVRSTSSFPFHNSNRTFTEWCVRKPPTWKGRFKKLGSNIRNAFHRIRV